MNKQVLLAKRPDGLPTLSTWKFEENKIPEPQEGEVLIKQHYISLDPAMRGWMREGKSYIPPVAINDVMRAGTVGEVIKANNNPKFKEGDFLSGWGGVQQYTVTNGDGYFKIDPNKAPLPKYLGIIGMPGMTAYFGILKVGELKEEDVVLVSGAAGAVGSLVGQIAKIKGCRVIGIAGGKDKCDYLVNELGFDSAIDYKNENVNSSLNQHCPDGIDVFFDNVGGDILDAALSNLRMHARIVICGAISQYNTTSKPKGPSNYLSLLVNRATMKGMVVFDFAEHYPEAIASYSKWLGEGKIKSKEDIYEGIENFHDTFLRLFSGEKLGKLVLKVLE
ncbi:MAG: NADP-dependent oxidoreductase [Flaviramulus sp.]|nr:NADP-dependent oxidoreductase [Flaviramulus sp.]NNC50822.1 NADP-dependent oxidoreductase [Flaviramulus sp.]